MSEERLSTPLVKAKFTVGVFLVAAKLIDGIVKCGFNVRTDQEKQRDIAKLPKESPILLCDCKGGGIMTADTSFEEALRREVHEETQGCSIGFTDGFRMPKILMKDPSFDLAFWRPGLLIGDPKPSNEALDHVWLSLEELKSGEKYRPVSGLGLAGRTGQMMTDAFAYYEENKNRLYLFS